MTNVTQRNKALAVHFLCLCLAVSIYVPLWAQSSQTPAGGSGFCFHSDGVNLPLGRFLLIRKDQQFGALRITRITPDTESKPMVSEWLGSVAYESYLISKPSDSFSKLVDSKRSGELIFGRMRGFGFHSSWRSGNQEAIVGPWKFLFFDQDGMFMTTLTFWDGINHDAGLQFAPTDIGEVSQLDPNEKGLHWYPYDRDRDIPCPVEAFSRHVSQNNLRSK